MRKIHQLLEEYGESHQNGTNKAIHWICVPVIFFSIVGLLTAVKIEGFAAWLPPGMTGFGTLASLVAFPVLIYYLSLSPNMFFGMIVWMAFCIWGNVWIENNITMELWLFSLILFVAAWIGQFIGHKIEGAKPSFFKDLQFLLIGPAWLMSFIYGKFGFKF
jgi:uncharacterized membrane protein YGL010W